MILPPNGFPRSERLRKYYLTNVIGNPLDTTVALTRIFHGGVLEDHPGLKLVASHGGGYLPFYSPAGRSYGCVRSGTTSPARRHLSQAVYVDCLVFDARTWSSWSQMGADHVVVGTDYPFDMGHYDPLGQIDEARTLSGEDREAIRGGTAARLLKLDL